MVPHFPYGHSHTHTRSHTPRLSHPDRAMLWGIWGAIDARLSSLLLSALFSL